MTWAAEQPDWQSLIHAQQTEAIDGLLATSSPTTREEVAALCLRFGRPALATKWSQDPLIQAAAQLRLGESAAALAVLAGQPETARPAVLRARAYWQMQQGDLGHLEYAQKLARREQDIGALIAAAALAGEMQLATPFAALRALAEGLKFAEVLGEEADPYLLAVLAHAKRRAGGQAKALSTAQKALERSEVRSPARSVAYLALDERAKALAEAAAGQLSPIWLAPFESSKGLSV